ncbi:MAG TPA: hypothetical protein VGM41_04045 [Chitinophagaceae bacterium]
MAIQSGPFYLERTIDDVCFYRIGDKYYVRMKSSLSRKQVLFGKRFRRTMESAGRMARGSKIGSVIYRLLPVDFREFWMYRSFVGEAVKLIKAGKTDEEAMLVLMERYAKEFMPGYAEEKEMKVKKPQGGLEGKRPEGRKIDMSKESIQGTGTPVDSQHCIPAPALGFPVSLRPAQIDSRYV